MKYPGGVFYTAPTIHHYAQGLGWKAATAWRLPTVRELLELTPSQLNQLGLSEIRDYWTSDRIGQATLVAARALADKMSLTRLGSVR